MSPQTGAPAPGLGLHWGFLNSAEIWPQRRALEAGDEGLTYAELRARALSITATLARELPDADPPLTGVFAYRSVTAFAGVLASLFRGHGYVPLNWTFPVKRTRVMLERAGCQAVIADAQSAPQLEAILEGTRSPRVIILPDQPDPRPWQRSLPGHRVLGTHDLEPASAIDPLPAPPPAVAYLLFTSGTTGVPKAVMITHASVCHFINTIVHRYTVSERDRFVQDADLTFDTTVLVMFGAWQRGACVCCPSASERSRLGSYIRRAKATVSVTGPSVAIFMKRLGMLRPGGFPTLRWSLFAGEPLPVGVARDWQAAAPNSRVENLYGPTEATVICTAHRWDADSASAAWPLGLVPIGRPLDGTELSIVDEHLREVPPGEQGELLIGGKQVGAGYWRDPRRSAASFIRPPGREGLFYRSGDRVMRPKPDDGPLVYLGRSDQQVKVHGERVELGEIEAALREATGVDAVVAVGWPRTATGVAGVEAFLGSLEVDVESTITALRQRLQRHFVPRRLHLLAELPLNANGKFDRRALLERLGAGAA